MCPAVSAVPALVPLLPCATLMQCFPPARSDFLSLPFQAVECSLASVVPTGEWGAGYRGARCVPVLSRRSSPARRCRLGAGSTRRLHTALALRHVGAAARPHRQLRPNSAVPTAPRPALCHAQRCGEPQALSRSARGPPARPEPLLFSIQTLDVGSELVRLGHAMPQLCHGEEEEEEEEAPQEAPVPLVSASGAAEPGEPKPAPVPPCPAQGMAASC